MPNSTPSAIEVNDESNRRSYDSHESLGFRQESRPLSTDAASASMPPIPTAIWDPVQGQPQENSLFPQGDTRSIHQSSYGVLPQNREELFLSDLADNANEEVDVDSPQYYQEKTLDDSMRMNDTSFILEKAAHTAIPSSQAKVYTSEPPKGGHRDYIKHTGFLESPGERLTQVLIWNLTRRIKYLEPRSEDVRDSENSAITSLMESVRVKLLMRQLELRKNSRELLSLKPKIGRELNEHNSMLYDRLRQRRLDLEEGNNAAFALEAKLSAKAESENMPSEADSGEKKLDYQASLYSDILSQSLRMTEETLQELLARIVETDGRISQYAEQLGDKLSDR